MSNIYRDIQKIEDLIRQCIPIPQKIYKSTKRLQTPKEVEKYFPGFLAFIDYTEQQIPRPVDNKRKKSFYSGKKKRHIVKTQVMVNNSGIIIHKTDHRKGCRHDYDMYKKNYPVTPKEGVVNVVDLGYLGIEKDFPEQLSSLPFKKKRNLKLSQQEIEDSKSHSKKRIVIEHTICRWKKQKIMNDVFRNRIRKYDKVSGFVNHNIMTS